MQVDPIRPTLKAPGTKRLKVKYHKPPSNFVFDFNLHRYNQGLACSECTRGWFLFQVGCCTAPSTLCYRRLVLALKTSI